MARMDTNTEAPMDTNQHRSTRGLTDNTLHALSAVIGSWQGTAAFGLILEQIAARSAIGAALFVLRLTQPDHFDQIVSDLGIESAAADDLIAEVAGDILPTDPDLDTHQPATIDIDPT